MGKKGGGLLHQAQKAAKQSIRQGKKQQQQGPAAKRHKAGGAGGGSGYNLPAKANQQQAQKKKAPQPKQHTEPTIPFAPDEAILLLGEGDLSFAASLATHYGCTNLTATVLERNLDELAEKYPHVHANIAKICPPPSASSSPPEPAENRKQEEKEEDDEKGPGNNTNQVKNESEEQEKQSDQDDKPETLKSKARPNNNKILYNIDARKFPPFVHKPTNKPLMDRIIFNFPHVGGKSTDVNRQVRYNQELLVDFFRRAVLSLSPGGTIIVTLFEGEPYTLWNIRDLARHSGLQVERSFRFQWGAYPGYGHVRTLGVLRDRKSGEVTGGGWKGEERLARSYVFVRKGEEGRPPGGGEVKKKKRKRGSGEGDESSSSSEDEEDYGDHEEEEGDEGGEDEDEEDGDE